MDKTKTTKGLSSFFVRESKKAETADELLKTVEKAVEAKDEGEVDVVDLLLSGQEIAKTLETDYGDFVFRFPTGADLLRIGQRRAGYLGGIPDSSYDNARRYKFEIWATLDVLVIEKPARFEKLTSWADFPDQDFVSDIYERGSLFCREVRERIKKSRPGKSVE